MRFRTIPCTSVALVAVLLAFPPSARADAPRASRSAAAEAFDDAVRRFEQADYQGAAKAFLKADDLSPSTDALHNAIAAARKANDHLLVATAAERAIARPNERQELVAEAREALALAAKNLAQLELGCAPLPCKLLVDGSPVTAGKHYVLPGAYSAVAIAEDGNRTEERLSLVAGVTYSVLLHATKTGASKQAAAVTTAPLAPQNATATGTVRNDDAHRAEPARPDVGRPQSTKPLSPPVFYVGVAATAVLVGVNIWSGVDTLSAKNNLPSPPTTAERDDVRAKETRSDIIFASALVVGAATIAAGLLWVDWNDGAIAASLAPGPDGATAFARGRF